MTSDSGARACGGLWCGGGLLIVIIGVLVAFVPAMTCQYKSGTHISTCTSGSGTHRVTYACTVADCRDRANNIVGPIAIAIPPDRHDAGVNTIWAGLAVCGVGALWLALNACANVTATPKDEAPPQNPEDHTVTLV